MSDRDRYISVADLKSRLRYWMRSRGMSKQAQQSLMETIKNIPYFVKPDISETLYKNDES